MADSPTSTTIVILISPPIPPSPPSSSSTLDLSSIQYVLGLVAFVSIPALLYLFLFAIQRPSNSPSSSGTRTARTSSSSPDPPISSVGVRSKSNFTGGTEIVSNDTKNYEEEANDPECAVCLSGFDGKEAVKQLSVCKHAFHANCIYAWLDSNGNTCPICRTSVGHTKRAADDPLPDPSDMV